MLNPIHEKEYDMIYQLFLPLYKDLGNLCLYRFLETFLMKTISYVIALIHYENYEWSFSYFKFFDEDIEDVNKEKIKSELLDKFPYDNRKDFFTYNINANGESKKAFVGTVYLHGYGDSNNPKPYYLVFVQPLLLKKEYIGKAMVKILGQIASVWFWRANYLYENRKKIYKEYDGSIQLSEYTEIQTERNKLLDLTVWPISLWDYIHLVDIGWNCLSLNTEGDLVDKDKNLILYKNWSCDIRKQLCIMEDKKKCGICRGEGDHNSQKDRKLYNDVIPLIPFIKEKSSGSYPNKLFNLAFQKLKGFEDLLFDRISCERLNDYSLMNFFAFKMWNEYLNSPENEKEWTSKVPSESEMTRVIHSSTNILLFLLKRSSSDSDFISSLRWAVSAYGHELLDIEPRLDLSKHLLFAERGEPVLHSLKPFYRDHFFHAIEVCFLGHFLLECKVSNRHGFLWQMVMKAAGLSSKKEVLRLWYIASLLHDIGYAIEIFNGTRKVFEFFEYSDLIKEFVKAMDQSLGSLSDSLDGFMGYTKGDKPGKDHGILAAEHLYNLRKSIKDSKEDISNYEYAFKAIAYHNHRKMKVSFKKDPFAFLLILCDTIQEWNRPHMNYSNAPDIMLSKLISTINNESATEYTGPLDKVGLNITKQSKPARLFRFKDPKLLRFQLFYTNEININSGVFNLWIDSTCNLQRLDWDGLPFNIEIQFVTPKYSSKGKLTTQMHRLREAAMETHMTFLHDWFPQKPVSWGCTNDAISHCSKPSELSDIEQSILDIDKKEVLILKLKELTKRKLITEDIKHFRDCLGRWKNYNEDRDFQGDYTSG